MFALIAALLALQPADTIDPIADLISATGEAAAAPSAPAAPRGCAGEFIEGGILACNWGAPSRVTFGDNTYESDRHNWVLIAIPRQTPEQVSYRVEIQDDGWTLLTEETRAVAQREYRLQRINGVPQSTVTPDPSTLPRRQREYAQKQAAFSSNWDGRGYLDGFIAPTDGVTTGVYGSARVYNNGAERGVHWGIDVANAVGTPVVAPAGGIVTLAEADMFYEGGLIFIDHGQGLVSAFLHLDSVNVEEGQIVEQGERIGGMGATGRSTGSHLDWRIKLRNERYIDPEILLQLDLEALDAE